MSDTKNKGHKAELLVADFLRSKGCIIAKMNYHSRFGEIDLIVKDRNYLVFVEVKLRKSDRFASAFEYVNKRKQDRIRVTASLYLSQNPTKLQPRFDVIEIYAPYGMDTRDPVIHHLEDAFQ